MARKRNSKPRKYTIQHGKLQHQTSARRFSVWLRAGLIVAIGSHLAHVSEAAHTIWENGELHLKPKTQPEPSLRTNAQIVDERYILAHEGQARITRDDRQRFADWRLRFGYDVAEQMIGEFLASKRQWDMRAQYGW